MFIEGQKRKDSNSQYIVHPVEVAMILQENNLSEDIIVAGLLHDILEYINKTEEDINIFSLTISYCIKFLLRKTNSIYNEICLFL